jgi:hypothetical protein
MATDPDRLSLISNAQTSVLAWLAIGLGTFIGVKALTGIGEVIYQIAICICMFSLGMIIVHMGDIYNWRKQLSPDFLPNSTKWGTFKLMDGLLNYIYEKPILILIICLIAGLVLESLLDTEFWKMLVAIKTSIIK